MLPRHYINWVDLKENHMKQKDAEHSRRISIKAVQNVFSEILNIACFHFFF